MAFLPPETCMMVCITFVFGSAGITSGLFLQVGSERNHVRDSIDDECNTLLGFPAGLFGSLQTSTSSARAEGQPSISAFPTRKPQLVMS
ncbi:hypothetical protein F5J12DRAFT_849693 [Pisolithus orientalis]|uniref:uncharacterized protein n=1 Tax=Pisolithus orientalis TaxID=936130 RepID=UPI0022258C3C|nr:uncharacterized protein F5J12DRAFT_849693 [Pisolithus orientalis]KAI5998329.1 hypothetical protein F5J12DRAFT_849693 [Pisolithus orientalis]